MSLAIGGMSPVRLDAIECRIDLTEELVRELL
jgi:hypothetical protein